MDAHGFDESILRKTSHRPWPIPGAPGVMKQTWHDLLFLMAAARQHRPDVAIVDVRMPPGFTDEGLRAAVELRHLVPDLGVLVLSQYVEEPAAQELLARGARGVGYLRKDRVADVSEFIDAVNRVARGGTALDPEVSAQIMARTPPPGPAGAAHAAGTRRAGRARLSSRRDPCGSRCHN